jgi:tetratricopeptide (TPR) repeat protein
LPLTRHLAIALTLACALGPACGGKSKRPAKKALPPPAPLQAEAYAHYLRGKLAGFEGDWQRAVAELQKASRAAPDESNIAIALSDALYQGGRRKAAMKESQQAIRRWPKSFPVWVHGGDLQRGFGNHQQAAENYRQAIKHGARSEAVHLAYAAELRKLGDTKKEEAQYRKLLAAAAGSAEVHYQLALLLHRQGRDKAATKHATKTCVLSPYDLRAWALLSTSQSRQGKTKEAKEALRQPFDRSGGNTFVGDQLLTELLDLDNQKAARNLVAILDRDDLPIDTRIGMGHLQLRLGDFNAALSTASALDEEIATSAAIAELRARALRALGRSDQAERQLLAIPIGQNGYALTRAMLAELLADDQKFERAEQVVEEALTAHPDNADLVLAQASVAEKSGNLERARGLLRAAIERHPKAQRPLYALAELETRHGQISKAVALITPLLEANPRDSSALNYVGYSLIEDASERSRARELLLRAIELSPDSSFILDSYGWLLFTMGELEQAAPYLERAARLTPTGPEIIWHLAELRWQQKAGPEALRLLARAESLALDRRLRSKIQRRRRILSAKP